MSRSRKEKAICKRLGQKKRWDEADARVVVQAWRNSGQPLRKFAREHGVGEWRLRWWVPRFDEVETPAKSDASPQASKPASDEQRLVPAMVALDGVARGPAIVVRLPDGIEVELRDVAEMDPQELGHLVAELRRAGA